jgi:hypothetical protein
MKKIVPVLAFALAATLAGNAMADSTPTTKADCEKAHMTWDDAHSKCVKK